VQEVVARFPSQHSEDIPRSCDVTGILRVNPPTLRGRNTRNCILRAILVVARF